MGNIFDLFKNEITYPDNTEKLNGVSMDTLFGYVSNTYLNGFINYMDIFHSIMIRRYTELISEEDEHSWSVACESIIKKLDNLHSDISGNGCTVIDDILMLGESDDSYWVLWNDRDCSDCSIGRLDKNHHSKEELINLLHESVPDIAHDNKEYIVLPKLTGWISL